MWDPIDKRELPLGKPWMCKNSEDDFSDSSDGLLGSVEAIFLSLGEVTIDPNVLLLMYVLGIWGAAVCFPGSAPPLLGFEPSGPANAALILLQFLEQDFYQIINQTQTNQKIKSTRNRVLDKIENTQKDYGIKI